MAKTAKRKRNKSISLLSVVLIITILISLWNLIAINGVKINTKTEIIELGETYTDSKQTATFFGKNISSHVKSNGIVNVEKVGKYEIIYTTPFSNKEYCKTIEVVDTTAPDIYLEGDQTIWLKSLKDYKEPGFIALDNYDGDLTSKVTYEIISGKNNSYEVNYLVQDSSGNSNLVIRQLKLYVGNVYLTFDDGPSLINTPKVLDILKKENVKAIFFVNGYNKSKTDIIKRMHSEGHTIALHGMSHQYSKIYQSIDSVMKNFTDIENLIKSTVEDIDSVKFIRFPGGSSNQISKKYRKGIMTEATKKVKEKGYVYFDWNIDSQDAGGAQSADEIYQNVINGLKPERDNIVLMHDSDDKKNTVLALEKIIEYCNKNKYRILPIDSNTTPVQHNVSN